MAAVQTGSVDVAIIVGYLIVWHTLLAAAPVYLVLRDMNALAISVVLLVVTSVFLKRNWFDKLEEA